MPKLSSSRMVGIVNQGTALKGNALFQVGETLFGKILGSVEGCVILSLCGESYRAKTTLSFAPGESIRVQVKEKKRNRIVLKLLSENASDETQPDLIQIDIKV